MTNSEAIEQLKFLKKVDFHVDTKESLDIATSALEHNSTLIEHISNLQNENTDFFNKLVESEKQNTKLKVEIERLKERLSIKDNNFELYSNALEEIEKLKAEIEQWQSTNLELVCELTRIECENNQLKSELEQSVKLPCKKIVK